MSIKRGRSRYLKNPRGRVEGPLFRRSSLACLVFLLTAAFVSPALCQDSEPEHEEHFHHVGFLLGSVYSLDEKTLAPGLGFEYERVLPFGNRLFGIGFGAEMVFDEHKHYVLSLLLPFHPVRPLTLFVATGIMFIDKNGLESRFAIHLGAEYEFELRRGFFLAPEFEIAFAGDDVHIMLGIHIGRGF